MFEYQSIIHRYIILELTLKCLEVDRSKIEDFKTYYAFSEWFEVKNKEVYREFLDIQNQFKKNKIRYISTHKDGPSITVYQFYVAGKELALRYNNIALRNWTNEEVKRLLMLPYRAQNEIR